MRFRVVEGFAFALRKNAIRCDVDALERLELEPNREPTATFLRPTVGYHEGSVASQASPFGFVQHDREVYYREVHPQTIRFQITRLILDHLLGGQVSGSEARRRVLRLQSRHQLFPQV